MYRRVDKFTKGIRDFSYDGVNLSKVNDAQERHNEELRLKQSKVVETSVCSLCTKNIPEGDSYWSMHVNSKGHRKKLKKYSKEYKEFVGLCRTNVLLSKRPRNRFLKRLKFYKLLVEYEKNN